MGFAKLFPPVGEYTLRSQVYILICQPKKSVCGYAGCGDSNGDDEELKYFINSPAKTQKAAQKLAFE